MVKINNIPEFTTEEIITNVSAGSNDGTKIMSSYQYATLIIKLCKEIEQLQQTPITLDEIASRGVEWRVQEIIYLMGGEHLSPQCSELTPKELNAFGYSHKVCECGEKGLSPEEIKVGYCLDCVGTQYEAFLEDCANNTEYEGGMRHEASADMQTLLNGVKDAESGNTVKLPTLAERNNLFMTGCTKDTNGNIIKLTEKERHTILFGEEDNDTGC